MALINRYQGNSGRVTRYTEPGERQSAPKEKNRAPNVPVRQSQPMGALGGLQNLGRLLPEKLGELETEDLILLLILYLMYKESGDSDLLVIMGAMFLL